MLSFSCVTKKRLSNQEIQLRFVNINPRKKSTGSQFAKLNPREMLKKMTRENKSNFSS